MAVDLIPCINDKVEARFWAKVDVRGEDECWPWLGAVCQDGYGQIGIQLLDGRHVSRRATHIALAIAGIPRGTASMVLHSCDNPPCVNLRHIRWGTAAENLADMDARGRRVRGAPKGEESVNAKLRELDIHSIRDDRRPVKEIAANYGVSLGLIYKVKSREIWRHI